MFAEMLNFYVGEGEGGGGNTDFPKLKYIAELGSGDSLLSQQVADSIQTSS